MKISNEFLPYLEGSSFNDALPVKVEQAEKLQDRMDFIEAIVRGKRVVHIGCLDHVPLIRARMQSNRWFHGRLTNVASECLGIDINQEGIDQVRSQLGIANIHYGDIESSERVEEIIAGHWDYAIFGEVLEHVDNPVLFLRKFVAAYGDSIDKLIITVPNVFRASNIRQAFKSLEVINSDHRYWFTPYTICKVVSQSGMVVEQLQMCKFDHTGNALREHVRDLVLRRCPILAEDIVAICRQP